MGGAAGAALIGGLTSGFAQGRRQAEDRAIQDEYKKVLMSKAKNDIEMHMLDQQDMQAASEGDQRALMRLLIKKDPMMAFAMSGQQGGQPQQPEVNIGMNYEEPAAPQTQVTFPAQLTGVPQMGSFDKERFMAHKLYGQTTNPADITGSDILLHPELQIPVRVPRDRRGYRWDLAQAVPPNIVRETEAGGPTGSQKSAYSGTTGRKIEAIPPIPQPVEIVRETVTNPDGSQSIIEVPKYPVQGQPQPQNRTKPTLGPKPGQPIQFDNKETLDEYVKTFGGGGGGIQTKPPADAILLESPIGETEAPLWFNKDGENPPVGMKIREAQGAGFKKLDATIRDKYVAKSEVLRELDKFYPLMEKVYGPEKDASANTWSIKGRKNDYATSLGALFKTDTDAAELKAWWTSSLPMNLKNKGQVGSLSDRDVAMGAESQPDFSPLNPDTPDLAWRKYRNLYDYYNLGKSKVFEGKAELKPSLSPKTANKTVLKTPPEPYEKMLDRLKKANPTTPVGELEKYLKGTYKYGN